MRRAAGTDVDVFDLYDAHIFRELKLAAVLKRFEHFLGRKRRRDLVVCGNGVICLALDLGKLLFGELAVKIYRNNVAAHVEADIVVPIFLMHEARYNMLAGVILHPAKARFPVDGAVVAAFDFERLVYIMQNLAILLMRVENSRIAYRAAVAELAAALGEKRRAVKGYKVSRSVLFTGGDGRREGLHVAVDIVKLLGHFYRSVFVFYDNNIFLRGFQSGSEQNARFAAVGSPKRQAR